MRTDEAQNSQDQFPAPEEPSDQDSFSDKHRGKAKSVIDSVYPESPGDG